MWRWEEWKSRVLPNPIVFSTASWYPCESGKQIRCCLKYRYSKSVCLLFILTLIIRPPRPEHASEERHCLVLFNLFKQRCFARVLGRVEISRPVIGRHSIWNQGHHIPLNVQNSSSISSSLNISCCWSIGRWLAVTLLIRSSCNCTSNNSCREAPQQHQQQRSIPILPHVGEWVKGVLGVLWCGVSCSVCVSHRK